MPNWTEGEYTKKAGELAERSVAIKRPITDLVEKVAREVALNPDEIRTLTRMTNVAAFQVHFRSKTGADRQVEYPVGDAEEIIARIHAQPVLPETANVSNDKMASYEDFDLAPRVEMEKVAFEEPVAPTRYENPVHLQRKLERTREEFMTSKISKEGLWEDTLASIHHMTRLAPGYGRLDPAELEKDAFATYGMDVLPELIALRELSNETLQWTPEKVAELQEYHTAKHPALMEAVKIAMAARKDYALLARAVAYVDDIHKS